MVDEELLVDLHPCPYCKSDALYVDVVNTDKGIGCTIACASCGMSGPVSFGGVDLAKRGWEALNKKMCRHCMDRLIRENKKLHILLKELK